MSYYKPNAIIKTRDGRIGTTCYNGLDGIGVKWGEHHFNLDEDFPEPDEIIKEPEKDGVVLVKAGTWGEQSA